MATVRKITVGSGAVFNHPHESFSNLRPSVVLEAVLGEGDDADEAARALQAQAEALLAGHKAAILLRLERESVVASARYEIRTLRMRIGNGQNPEGCRERLRRIAEEFPDLAEEAAEALATEPRGEAAIARASIGSDDLDFDDDDFDDHHG
jgi:hypothetical protein